jgi:hypothetical protein
MKKFEKYLVTFLVGSNIGMSIWSSLLGQYTLGLNQALLALFIALYYNEKNK